jgi:WD40 repeat protein
VSHRPTKPYAVVTASEDLSINTYKGPPYKFEHSFKDHARYPNSVRFSPDGAYYVSVGADSKIFLFNGETGEKVKEIGGEKKEAHTGSIFEASWSPDSKSLLTCSGDKTAKIWDVESGHCKTTFTINKKPQVEDMQISCVWHEDYLLSVSLSGAINYLDVAHPDAPKKIVHGHSNALCGFAADVKNGMFYVSDIEGRVGAWNFKSGECQWLAGKGHEKPVVALALSGDGKTLSSVGLDDKIRFNSVDSHSFKEDATALGGKPVAVAHANKDKDLIAVVTAQEKLVLLRGSKVVSTSDLGCRPNNVVFSPSDNQLAVSGKDYKVHLFEVSHDAVKPSKVLDNHLKEINVVAYNNAGTTLVSAGKDRNIFFWVNDKPQNATGWCFHNAQVTDISFSPSGDRLVSGSADEGIIVWKDTKTWETTRQTIEAAHCAGVDRVFFWDDKTVLSLGADRVIKIWDV